jgi:putative solute:sodium symporter small subunit
MELTERHREYWRRNLRITAVLMVIWFVITFVVAYYARSLSFTFFGWPFSFWVGAQGAQVVYVLMIWYNARPMNRHDQEFGLAEGE